MKVTPISFVYYLSPLVLKTKFFRSPSGALFSVGKIIHVQSEAVTPYCPEHEANYLTIVFTKQRYPRIIHNLCIVLSS